MPPLQFFFQLLLIALALGAMAFGAVTPPGKVTSEIKAARLYFYEADGLPEASTPERKALLEKGVAASEDALKAAPQDPGVVLWWAANEGALAAAKRSLWSLSAIRQVEKELLWLSEKFPDYGYAAADRALGKLYLEAPRFFSVGSTSKALERMRRAVQRHPEFPGNRLGLAEVLLDKGMPAEAERLVTSVVIDPLYRKGEFGDFTPDREIWHRTVDKLQRELGAKQR